MAQWQASIVPQLRWGKGGGAATKGGCFSIARKGGCEGFTHQQGQHSGESAAIAATPYPAAPDFPLFRGQNRPLYAFPQSHVAHWQAPIVPPEQGWQRNWICRGAKRPENPVTCFPLGKGGGAATKGGRISIARKGGCLVLSYWRLQLFKRCPPRPLPLERSVATLGPCDSTGPYAPLPRSGRPPREYREAPPRRLVFSNTSITYYSYCAYSA